MTDINGYYKFSNIPAGSSVNLSAAYEVDSCRDDCINVHDMAIIRGQILGASNALSFPFGTIAADVNGNAVGTGVNTLNGISTLDQVIIQRTILGQGENFYTCWRFLDPNFDYQNGQTGTPDQIDVDNILADEQVDFTAVQIGDVNSCCDSFGASFLEIQMDTLDLNCDSIPTNISIPISVKNFNSVKGLQFSINWNPNHLQYVGTGNYGIGDIYTNSFGETRTALGEISFVWLDQAAQGVTLADGTTIFELNFNVVQSISSAINFSNTPVTSIAVNQMLEQSSPIYQNGYVKVDSSSCPDTCVNLAMATYDACQGDQICLDITASNFVDIVAMQYTLSWNSSILQYINTQNYNLSGLNAGNFNGSLALSNGQLANSWFDNTATGVTVPDGTVLYQVCFDALQNGSTNIDFTNGSASIEFSTNSSLVCHNLTNGQVNINSLGAACVDCDTIAVRPAIIATENCVVVPRPFNPICNKECTGRPAVPNNGMDTMTTADCLITCDSSIQIYHAVLHAGSAYQWSVVGGIILGSNMADSVIVEWGSQQPASVILIETDVNGCTDSTSICIEFVESPTANFSYAPVALCAGSTIDFTNLSVDADSYLWDFGDGTISTDFEPTHTYATGGTKTVCLIVTNTIEEILKESYYYDNMEQEQYCACVQSCTCTDTIKMDIVIDPKPAPPILCTGTSCVGDTVCYTTPDLCVSGNYNWTVGTNGIIVDGGAITDTFVCVHWIQGDEGIVKLGVSGCINNLYCSSPNQAIIPIIDPNNLAIDGETEVCWNSSHQYKVPKFTGAVYDWQIINSFNGTITSASPYQNSINVDWNFGPIGKVVATVHHLKKGCSATDTLEVNVRPAFEISGQELVCENTLAVYSVNQLYGYTGDFTWSVTGGTIQGVTVGTAINVLWNTNADNYAITTVPNDLTYFCENTATYFVQVVAPPTKPDLVDGPLVICPNGNYQYTADVSPLTGDIHWQITGGTATPAIGEEVLITWDAVGPYEIRLFQKSATNPYCESEVDTTDIAPVQSISVNGSNSVCINSTSTYTASILPTGTLPTAEEIVWTIAPTTAGSVINGQGTTTADILWNNDVGAATVTANYCGGAISNTFNVQVISPPTPTINAPTELCVGETGIVTVNGNFNNTKLTCLTNPSLNYTMGAANNPSFTNIFGGCCYLFEGTDATTGCIVQDTFCIGKIGPTAEIVKNSTLSICNGSTTGISVSFSAYTGTGYSYQWQEQCGAGSWTNVGTNTSSLTRNNVNQICSYRCIMTLGICTDTSNVFTTYFRDCTPGIGCAPEPYTLDFDVTNCNQPYVFQKTTTTTANVTNIQWLFDDGTPITSGNPISHTYTEPGGYTVCMRGLVPSADGSTTCVVDTCKQVIVPLIVDWDWQFLTCGSGSPTYQFTDLSLTGPGYNIISYEWTFTDDCGGGTTTSNTASPTQSICSDCGSAVPITLEVIAVDNSMTLCTVSVTKNIDLAGSQALANTPTEACVGEKVAFTSASCGATEYLWDFGDGASSALENPFRTYTTAGTYIISLSVKDEYGCSTGIVDYDTIIIHPLPIVTISATPASANVCEGATVTLTASPSSGITNYEWFDATTNVSLQSGTSPTFVAHQTGFYYVEVTDNNNCKTRSADQSVVIYEFPTIDIEGDLQICSDEMIHLIAPTGYLYEWKLNGFVNNTFPPNEFNRTLPLNPQLELTLTQPNAPMCSLTIQIPVIVDTIPDVPIISGLPTPSCEGDAVILMVTNASAAYNYQWSNGNTGTTITIQPALVGAITVNATDPNTGCSRTSSNYYIEPLPDVCFVPTGCYEACNSDTICVPDYFASYQWMKDGALISGATDSCLVVTMSGQYQVILGTSAGCVDTSGLIEYVIEVCDTTCCLDSLTFCNQVEQGWSVQVDDCSVTVSAPQFDTCSWLLIPPNWGDGSTENPPSQGCDNGMVLPTNGTSRIDTLVCCSTNENVFNNKIGFGNYDDAAPTDNQLTICPPSNASAVLAIITSFDVAVGDTLFVYDGEDTTYPIVGKWTGAGTNQTGGFIQANNSPYNNPSGCLTFRFVTNGDGISAGGWRMEIGCNDRPLGLGINNTWTHTYDTSGTYIICAQVFTGNLTTLDSCMSKMLCDTIVIDACPSITVDTCCDEANNLIANGAFEGYSDGDIPSSSVPWMPSCRSPRITNIDGCDSLGCLQMWGNQLVGECTEQLVNVQAGNTYRLNFCARYVNSHPQAPLWAQVQIRAGNSTLPEAGCPGTCEVVYTTPQMSTFDWQQFCYDWTPENDYDRISIRVINDQNIDNGNYVSRARIDDVCLELIGKCGANSIAVDTLATGMDSCCYALDLDLSNSYHSVQATVITSGVVFDTVSVNSAIHQITPSTDTNAVIIRNINGGRQPITAGTYNDFMTFCFGGFNDPIPDTQCVILDYYNLNEVDVPQLECSDTVKFYCAPIVEDTCHADFTYTIDDCGEVCFTDLSTGSFTDARWYFTYGSGIPARTLNDTCFQYPTTGTFTVCREIFDTNNPNECYDSICKTIIVPALCDCQANFTASLTNNCREISLTNQSTSSDNLTYKWLVNNVQISTATNPTWTAPDTGLYQVCLEIMDDNNCKDTLWQTVGIYDNLNPVVQCRPDTTIRIPACDRGVNVNFALPFTIDNCGVDSVWCSKGSGEFFECGTTTVTCYARDTYGNVDSCQFRVTVSCECAEVIDRTISCGSSPTDYDFCIWVKKFNGADTSNCTFTIGKTTFNTSVKIDEIDWLSTDTAKISGTISTTRPIPTILNFELYLECTCPDNQMSKCRLPNQFVTPCCDSVFIEGQEVCESDSTFHLALNGSIDFSNIARTVWYVQQGPCPTSPFGGTPYQTSIGYADLLLLPNYYSSDVCVYAEVLMANGPCQKLTTNLDTIEICKPVTCSLTDTAYCYSGSPITPDSLCLTINQNGQDCEYSIIWLDENGDTIPGETGLKYQPPAIDFVGPADACSYSVTYQAVIKSVCGSSTCSATIRLDNDNADVGQISISYPNKLMPYCPGQDVTLSYEPACVGEPPMWNWHYSEDGTNYTAIPTAGTQNPVYNTNRLFKTTWFMVTKQNGVCTTPDSTIIKIDVKDSLRVNQFTAIPADACRKTGVNLNVAFTPCTSGTANSCNCDYTIRWYKNGQVIHLGNYANSPATFNYVDASLNGDYSGNYYAVVSDNCCNQTQKSAIVPIAPPMKVLALGPCFQCFDETVTLNGVVENASGACTYQWYFSNGGSPTPVGSTQNIFVNQPGTYVFEATCGSCIEQSTFVLKQCNDICGLDDIRPTAICNNGLTLSLNGLGEATISPSDIDNGSFDNCTIDTMYLDTYRFDCNDIGNNTVNLIVVDALGNRDTCATSIVVQDLGSNCRNFCMRDTIQLDTAMLTGTQIYAAKVMADITTAVQSGSHIVFQARDKVIFKPGFHARRGSRLAVRIADCENATPATASGTDTAESRTQQTPTLDFVHLNIRPNPFRYRTNLVIDLPTAQKISLAVFDQSGRMVHQFFRGEYVAKGQHEVLLSASGLVGGLYIVRLQTASRTITKKVILVSDGGLGKGDDD
ncbi:MAG: PKD domain-containing protein [Bacteroidota bacterium]